MQAGLALFFEDFNEFRRAVDLGHLYSGFRQNQDTG
jgi:hypothetical protein